MKENRVLIKINKPPSIVFAFTLDPKNTPKWIDSILQEQTSEWPVREGTIYKNQSEDRSWSEYVVTSFKENESFIFSKENYHVKYTFKSINENQTELEYFEWVDSGDLEEPFTVETLKNLKRIIEND